MKGRIFVLVQFALFMIFLFVPKWPFQFAYAPLIGSIMSGFGMVVLLFSLLQLNTSLSPFPAPKKDAKLVTDGIYKYMRHPIYIGILLLCFGISLFQQDISKLLVSILLSLLFYFKSSYEETLLVEKYGSAYEEYRSS